MAQPQLLAPQTSSNERLQSPKVEADASEVVAPLTFIGGGGGSQYSVRGWQEGKLVKRLRVYSGEWQIKAIRLWMSGDEEGGYKEIGKPEGAGYEEFSFEDGERLTSMSLWGNGAGSRAGWIKFETNKRRSFSYGMYGWPRKHEYEVNVGSGILVGAIYNAGADIDAHGYFFLNASIASTRLTDVSYPTLQWDSSQIAPEALDTFAQTNSSSVPVSWSFGGSRAVTSSSSWASSTEVAFEVKVTMEAGVPEVAKAGTSFGWRVGKVTSHQRSEEHRHELRWNSSGQLQPGASIHLVALTRRGNLIIPYTATAVVTLANGASLRFPQSGTYTGVAYTGVEVQDNPDAKYAKALANKPAKRN